MSSINACLALSRGRDFEGSGCQSSVAEVWRTSKFSPGADEEFMLRMEIGEGACVTTLLAVFVSDLVINIECFVCIANFGEKVL